MSRRGRRGAFLGSAGRGGLARWSVLYGAAPTDVMLTITQPVLFDIDALVHGLEIEGAGKLIFDPGASRLLQVDQQRPVCVMEGGHLEMSPASAAITHEIRFVNVDESLFTAGGGMNHTANPGLCVENATVTLRGATKKGWTRTTAAMLAGATTCTVVDATGWRIGDEIVITPTEAVTVSAHYNHFDRKTLTNVVGNTLTFTATTYPHPSNTTPGGTVIYPEVLNLTRNVKITGQDATHRAQTMFMEDCTGSILEYFEGKFLGPRQASEVVLGRYGLHFHRMFEGSRNLRVQSVSMHDLGSRAFVPHGSHGMTFTDCVAWDVFSNAYWWDVNEGEELIDETNDLLYDTCFAGRVLGNDTADTGFYLSAGTNMTIRNCCAAGIPGNTEASGYHWPSKLNENPHNLWTAENNDSHNNKENGVFIWQNDGNDHNLNGFRCWNNHVWGIKGGAYVNQYNYNNSELWGNLGGDFGLFATTGSFGPGIPGTYRRVAVTGGHINIFHVAQHRAFLRPDEPIPITNVAIDTVAVNQFPHEDFDNSQRYPSCVDFINCGLTPDDFLVNTMFPPTSGDFRDPTGLGTICRIQTGASAWKITTTTGYDKVVTPIALFYP